jgi:hypothetical protein
MTDDAPPAPAPHSLLATGHVAGVLPAATLAVFVVSVLCGMQLLPFGQSMLLVRVSGAGAEAALLGAARADAAFVDAPAPGFAVVYGDAAQVRSVFGLAVPWKGNAPCSPPS